MNANLLFENFDLLAEGLSGVKNLRALILQLAFKGKLVLQDPKDESATLLLEKIKTEKRRLFKDMDVGPSKMLSPVSPDDFPFELPEGWVWARLGEIAQHNSGKTLDSGRNTGSLREYLTTSNLYWGYFELANLRRMPIEDDEVDRCTASRGDLLICEGGEAGRAAVWNEDYVICFQNHIHRVRLLCSINPYYVFRYFQKMNYTGEINLHRKGMGISNISGRALSLIVVPLSPISEQRRIVAKVDQLMALCDDLEREQKKRNEARISLNASALDHLVTAKDPKEFDTHWQRIITNFDLLYDKPETVGKLRQAILQLAVQGKLTADFRAVILSEAKNLGGDHEAHLRSGFKMTTCEVYEPATILLEKISAEKERLIKERKIKRSEPLSSITKDEVPYELPKGWVWCRLGEIISISSGDGLTSDKMEKTGSVPVFGGNGITGHHDAHNVSEPTIVIGRVGFYCGSVHVTPSRAWVTDNAFITWFLHQFLFIDYLYWLLKGSDLGRNDNSTAQPVISGRKVYPIIIGLPPFDEQRRIVEKLTQLMKVCDELETKLIQAEKASEELVEAVVREVVG